MGTCCSNVKVWKVHVKSRENFDSNPIFKPTTPARKLSTSMIEGLTKDVTQWLTIT